MTTLTLPDTQIRTTIQKDLTSFADPRTEVVVTDRDATWTQKRVNRQVQFITPLSQAIALPKLRFEGRVYDYAGFFASETMADLKWLAEQFPPALASSPNFVTGVYIPGMAAENEEATQFTPADELVAKYCTPNDVRTRTSLILLQGRAGDGKSSLLTHLAHDHAERFLRGETTWLYFYIDAQGRALARLDEAFAYTLQDCRASFTYHALGTLTRLGLVVPIVDGFDELLGSGGYEDAFASLAAFIRRLDGRGAIIASARSTFYKYSALGRVTDRRTTPVDVEIHPIFLSAWTDQEAGRYILKSGAGDGLQAADPPTAVEKARTILRQAADEVLSSPFLLSQFVAQIMTGEPVTDTDRFLHTIIRSLVKRELVDKIRDTFGNPILNEDGHIRLLGSLAEEMWLQEQRFVDDDTFRTVADLISTELKLDPRASRLLQERFPSHAFIRRTNDPVRIEFRHEYYYGYFLAQYLEQSIRTNKSIEAVLTRSNVTQPIADEFAAFVSTTADAVGAAVSHLSGMRPSSTARELQFANAGVLAAALIRKHNELANGANFRSMIFDAVDLKKTTLKRATFDHCSFIRVDLSDANWQDVRCIESTFSLPVVSTNSFLKFTGLRLPENVVGLAIRQGANKTETFDPTRIHEELVRRGVIIEAPTQRPLTNAQQKLVEDLHEFLGCIKYTMWFTENDFTNRRRPFGAFDGIVKTAQLVGILESGTRTASGNKKFYRLLVDPDQLKAGQAGDSPIAEVRSFWMKLLAE